MENAAKAHWDKIYAGKSEAEYSWFQPAPTTSLEFIEQLDLPSNARIIDVGGGDSHLADALLERGFTNITVLDISAAAIEKAKQRLGTRAAVITWIVSDILDFEPGESVFDFWHDRAAFHFLTSDADVRRYAEGAGRAVRPGGYLLLGTFSTRGPKKCSGLDIRQYTRTAMDAVFSPWFRRLRCRDVAHTTPFGTEQRFLFCLLGRRER